MSSTSDVAAGAGARPPSTIEIVRKGLRKRYRSERRFRFLGLGALLLAVFFLVFLLFSIVSKGYSAFYQAAITLELELDPEVIDPDGTGDPDVIGEANFTGIVRGKLREMFPDVSGRRDRRALNNLVSGSAGFQLRDLVLEDPSLIGQTVSVTFPASDDVDLVMKGHTDRNVPESERRVSDKELAWIDTLEANGQLGTRFNTLFFTQGDSRDPEMAGIWGAVMGSFYMLLVTLTLSFPIGVAAAIYLEEFAPKNRWTDLIEVNINNLAAVPSIVFGLLGLAVFLNFFEMPRSAPVVGGLVLTLMTLPTIIISSRAAIKSVPPSIREAALGMGASRMQTVFHHIVPLAMPGMLTGTIIGMAQALGESAPLLMIGMVAFIVDIPQGMFDSATVLPVQIFLWADSPERAFVEKTSGAIMVLLAFLITMNLLAVLLRKKFERRW